MRPTEKWAAFIECGNNDSNAVAICWTAGVFN